MNEEAVKDGYDYFVKTGYKGTLEDYIKLMDTNPEAVKDTYAYFQKTGYKGSEEDFNVLFGLNQEVKKKDIPEQPSPLLPPTPLVERQELEEGMVSESPTPDGESVVTETEPVVDTQDLEEVKDKYVIDGTPVSQGEVYRKMNNQEFLAKLKEGTASIEVSDDPEMEKYVQEQTAHLGPERKPLEGEGELKDIMKQEEESAVPFLNYYFEDKGVTFEQTGVGDATIATIRDKDGNVIAEEKFDLDVPTKERFKSLSPFNPVRGLLSLAGYVGDAGKEAKRLEDWVEKNQDPVRKLEAQKTEQLMRFKDKEDIDATFKEISSVEDDMAKVQNDFVVKSNELESNAQKLEGERIALDALISQGLASQEQIDAYNASVQEHTDKVNALQAEGDAIREEIDNHLERRAYINKSVGRYAQYKNSLKSKGVLEGIATGDILGAAQTALAVGASRIGAGNLDYIIDGIVEVVPRSAIEGPQDKDKSIDDLQDEMKKELKAAILPAVREGAAMFLGGDVPKEYMDSAREEFVYGAILGVAESIPAMIGPSPVSKGQAVKGIGKKIFRYLTDAGNLVRAKSMAAQVSDHLNEEMMNNPEFKNITEGEKKLITAPIAIVSGVLENLGFRNIVNRSGLLQDITMSVLRKSGKKVTAETFEDLVQKEVKSRVARGVLTVASAGLAEAETGGMQEIADIYVKRMYNMAKDKEMFDTPEAWSKEYYSQVAKSAVQEAIGGMVMGSIGGVVAAANNDYYFDSVSDLDFDMFLRFSKDSQVKSALVSEIKNKINDPNDPMTKEEGQRQIDQLNQIESAVNRIPSDYSLENKRKALSLLMRQDAIKRKIANKDERLTKRQRKEIDKIDGMLDKVDDVNFYESEKQEQDAIQEPSTETVDVQESTQDSGEVGARDTEGELTEEGEAEVEAPTTEVEEEVQPVTEEVITEFRDTGVVPEPVIRGIAIKTLDGKALTEQEQEIYDAQQEAVDNMASDITQAEEIQGEGVVDSQGRPVAHRNSKRVQEGIRRQARRAKRALSVLLPNLDIVLHDKFESFEKAVPKAKGRRGVGGVFDGKNTIHINLEGATATTVAHEIFHAAIKRGVKSNKQLSKLTDKMLSSVLRGGGKALKEVVKKDAQGNDVTLREYLEEFATRKNDKGEFVYKESLQSEEQLAELAGILAASYMKMGLNAKTSVKAWIAKAAKALSLGKVKVFTEAMSDKEAIDLLNTIAGATADGKKLRDLKTIDEVVETETEEVSSKTLDDDGVRFQEGSELLAPNGKPSNLTPEQHKLVRTPEFKKWFGDWQNDPKNASKVVDENGEPLVVYHGGPIIKGDSFRKGYADGNLRGDKGIYFTENKEFAKYFAHQNELVERDKRNFEYDDIPESELETGEPFNEKYFKYSEIYPVFLNLKKPTISETGNANLIPRLYEEGADGFITKSTSDFGYDAGQYIAFEPNQIKLADGTNVTFSEDTKDIRFQDPSANEFTIYNVVNNLRGDGYTDSAIALFLSRQINPSTGTRYTRAEIREAMKISLDKETPMPSVFGDVEGGVAQGQKLFVEVLTKLKNSVRSMRPPTNAKKRAKAHQLLKDNPIFQAQNKIMQYKLILALDKSLGTTANQVIQAEISAIKKIVSGVKMGDRQLRSVQARLKSLIRKNLPQSQYKKSEINALIKLVTDARIETIQDITEQIEQKINEKKIEILEAEIEKILNTKVFGRQGGRAKGKGIDIDFADALAEIKNSLQNLTDPDAIQAEIENLLKKRGEVFEKDSLTKQEQAKIAAYDFAIAYLATKNMEEAGPDRVKALENSHEMLKEFIKTGRSLLKEQLKASHEYYVAQADAAFKDITGIDLSENAIRDEINAIISSLGKGEVSDAQLKKAKESLNSLLKSKTKEGIFKMSDGLFKLVNEATNDNIQDVANKVGETLEKNRNDIAKENLKEGEQPTPENLKKAYREYVKRVYSVSASNRASNLKRAETAMRMTVDSIVNFFSQQEDISGLMDTLSKSVGKMFGGYLQEDVTDRIDDSSYVFKQGKKDMRIMLEDNMKRIFGERWRKINGKVNTRRFKTGVFVDGKELERSQNQIYYYYNLAKDPANHGSFENMWGKNWRDTMNALEKLMTPEVKEWADWQVDEFYPKMYERYNEVYRRVYRTNLPWNQFYAGRIYREGVQPETPNMLADAEAYQASVAGASTKLRRKNNNKIAEMDGNEVLTSYILEMERFRAFQETIRDISKMFNSELVSSAIKEAYGEKFLAFVKSRLEAVANGGVMKGDYAFVGTTSRFFVFNKIAGNLVVTLKQLTSIPTYANDIGFRNWAKTFAQLFSNPSEALKMAKEVYNNSIYLQDRYSEDFLGTIDIYAKNKDTLMPSGTTMSDAMDVVIKSGMAFTKAGDAFAIFVGGVPNYVFYKNEFKKKNPTATEQMAIDYAIRKFQKDTKKAQQSGDIQDRDYYQTENQIVKAMQLFLTTPKQYHRKSMSAYRQLYRKMKAMDAKAGKGTVWENTRTLIMYRMMMPMFFQWISMGAPPLGALSDEEEENLMRALLLGNINAVWLVGDALNATADYFLGKPYASEMTQLPVLQRISRLIKVQQIIDKVKNEETKERWRDVMRAELLDLFMPYKTVSRTWDNWNKMATGEEDFSWRKAIGYSDYVIDNMGFVLKEAEALEKLRKAQEELNEKREKKKKKKKSKKRRGEFRPRF